MSHGTAAYYVINFYAQRCLVGFYLFVLSMMLIHVIKRLRCGPVNKYGERKWDVSIVVEASVYAFYTLCILWALSHLFSLSAVSLSRLLDNDPEAGRLCNVAITLRAGFAAVYNILLTNILANRVHTAFESTPFEVSKCTNYGIRIASVVIWCSAYLYMIVIIASAPIPSIEGDECLFSDLPGHVMQKLNILYIPFVLGTLGGTFGLWLLFMFKLFKFRKLLAEHGSTNSDDFLMTIIQKQSFLIFWVVLSTLMVIVLRQTVNDYVGRAPLLVNNAMNAIAIFLSFSFNEDWYTRCGCHQCVRCCYESPCARIRARSDVVRSAEIEAVEAVDIEMKVNEPTLSDHAPNESANPEVSQQPSSHEKQPGSNESNQNIGPLDTTQITVDQHSGNGGGSVSIKLSKVSVIDIAPATPSRDGQHENKISNANAGGPVMVEPKSSRELISDGNIEREGGIFGIPGTEIIYETDNDMQRQIDILKQCSDDEHDRLKCRMQFVENDGTTDYNEESRKSPSVKAPGPAVVLTIATVASPSDSNPLLKEPTPSVSEATGSEVSGLSIVSGQSTKL